MQHAMTNHRDEICCHCGASRCVYLKREIPPGHGKYTPDANWVTTREIWHEERRLEPPETR
jgi:hypothetical protein